MRWMSPRSSLPAPVLGEDVHLDEDLIPRYLLRRRHLVHGAVVESMGDIGRLRSFSVVECVSFVWISLGIVWISYGASLPQSQKNGLDVEQSRRSQHP